MKKSTSKKIREPKQKIVALNKNGNRKNKKKSDGMPINNEGRGNKLKHNNVALNMNDKREEVESSRRLSKERRSYLALAALILIVVVGYSALTANQTPQTLDQLNTQESISFELSLAEASREYVDAVLKGSDDTINKYYNPEYSQAKGVPKAFNDPRWGNGITYSPLDANELKPCFEKISIDSTDIDFKADPRNWDVLIIDRDASYYFFTTKDGKKATVAFYVRGRRGGPYYLNSIFLLGCN